MQVISNPCVPATVAILLFLSGCNTSQFPVKPARGKVVCEGKPVASGSVSFTPVGSTGGLETGKPAAAAIGPDGTFLLSTYGRFDGAIVGKHRVQFTGAEDDEAEEEADDSSADELTRNAPPKGKLPRKQPCVQSSEIIVEVTASGQNDFTIELSPVGK